MIEQINLNVMVDLNETFDTYLKSVELVTKVLFFIEQLLESICQDDISVVKTTVFFVEVHVLVLVVKYVVLLVRVIFIVVILIIIFSVIMACLLIINQS